MAKAYRATAAATAGARLRDKRLELRQPAHQFTGLTLQDVGPDFKVGYARTDVECTCKQDARIGISGHELRAHVTLVPGWLRGHAAPTAARETKVPAFCAKFPGKSMPEFGATIPQTVSVQPMSQKLRGWNLGT